MAHSDSERGANRVTLWYYRLWKWLDGRPRLKGLLYIAFVLIGLFGGFYLLGIACGTQGCQHAAP